MGIFELLTETIKKYHGKIVMISGGRGYIGSLLAQTLTDTQCRIILLDRSSENLWVPERHSADLKLCHGNVAERQTWETVLPEVDVVFHLAGLEYQRNHYDPMGDLDVNALSVWHLLEVCREFKHRPRIIFSSSASLFGRVDISPVSEDMWNDPSSLWCAHKRLAENYLRIYSQRYGIETMSLRLANIYGPTARAAANDRVVLNQVISNALRGEGLKLFDNRKCIRDYIYLKDVVRALLFAGVEKASAADGRFFVIGSGQGIAISDAWQMIAGQVSVLTGKKVPIEVVESVNMEPFEMRNFVADASSFGKPAGWKPETPMKKGLETTVKALRALQ